MIEIENKSRVLLKNGLTGEVFLMQDEPHLFLLHCDFGFKGPFHIEEVTEILEAPQPRIEKKRTIIEMLRDLGFKGEKKC